MAIDDRDDLVTRIHARLAQVILAKLESGEATAADVRNAIQWAKDHPLDALVPPGARESAPQDHRANRAG